MMSSTSTSRPASVRSRETCRTAAIRGLAGGARDPRASTMRGGKARRTTCQLRRARARRRSPIDPAARPLDRGVRMSRHLRHRDLGQDVREDRRGPDTADPRVRFEDQAVRERGARDRLDVIRGHEVPTRDGGPRPRRFQEGEGSPRARPDFDLAVRPRRDDDVDHVSFDGGIHVDFFDRGLEGPDLVRRRDWLDRRIVRAPLPTTLEHLDLLVPRRIADVDAEQEAVHLCLRKRIGPLVLNRVLRRHHEEGSVESEGLSFEGRLPLLHRLEQGGLRLRRRAVDLVRKEDIREDRASPEDELARLAIVHVGPRDVGRQEVRRELNAAERESETGGERFGDQRLRDPRDVLDQEVAVPKDRPEHALQDQPLADDHGFDRIEEGSADLRNGREVQRQASIRERTSRKSRAKPPQPRARRTHSYCSSRSPTRMWRNSARASSRKRWRSLARSRWTSRIASGDSPSARRARSRKATRAREVTRTWLYRRPRVARRTETESAPSSPGMYGPDVWVATSGPGSEVPRTIRRQARATISPRNARPRSHCRDRLNSA